jgi:hypothetical protein
MRMADEWKGVHLTDMKRTILYFRVPNKVTNRQDIICSMYEVDICNLYLCSNPC